MRTPEKMLIYNLFPLLAGPFSRWESHLSRAGEMGFSWIFVNPIQKPGLSGSIYAIADYYEINPALVDASDGRSPDEQVRQVNRAANGKGLKTMIDLVVNHCSIDSGLLEDHPDWFERDGEGRVVHPFAKENGKKVVWGDLARFDYTGKGRDGLYRYMSGVLEHLIGLGFSGFRCDAAYQIPLVFWNRLISSIKKKYPDVLFAAETLGCTPRETRKTASAGFDYIFNSSKWWDYKGHWLLRQYNLTRDMVPSIGFPESHDTVRLMEELDGNVSGVKQRYLFAALFSAGVMVTMGFEYGFRRKPHVVETTPQDWEDTGIDLRDFITAVNEIKSSHRIFREEGPNLVITENNPRIFILWKGSPSTGQEALILLNTDTRNRQGFQVPDISGFFESRAGLMDVSPEERLEHIPQPFSLDFAPGQGKVLVTADPETGTGRKAR